MNLRPYQPEDWQAIAAIHDAARREELALAGLDVAFVPLAVAAEREGLFDDDVAVAEADGRVAGFVAYTSEELAWLYVDPACRRLGVGRALAEYALCRRGRELMTVEVLVGNTPARALYESLGFRVEETLSGVMPGNEAFTVSVWSMRLGAPACRRLTPTDMPCLARLQRAYKAAIGEEAPTEADLDRLARAMERGDILFYGAQVGGMLAGMCSVSVGFSTFDYRKSGMFEDFYVTPAWHGRGVARALANFAHADSGVSTLMVGCADCDRAMYEALGFRVPLGQLMAWE